MKTPKLKVVLGGFSDHEMRWARNRKAHKKLER